jgi:hypothetical protein
MNADEENSVEAPFELKSLEEAATYDFLELQEGIRFQDVELQKTYQAFYLEQVYNLIQKTMVDKGWQPLDAGLMIKWEDQLWRIFLSNYKELSEFIPNCEKPGYTMASLLWITLCGLNLLNHCWREEPVWRTLYNKGATGKLMYFPLSNFLVICLKPIISHTCHDLMGQLFALTTRFYELEYHPELEIWINWLLLRTSELMYIVTTRELFNSQEYCAPRPASATLFGVSDAFVQETCRLFYELKGAIYRYKMYPRLLVECNSQHVDLRERQINFPSLDRMQLPIEQTLSCDHHYIAYYFYARPEDQEIIGKRWSNWVEKNLKPHYHDRSRITLHKTGLVQALRPGEMARATASNQGVTPGYYEILKKNRPLGALDHLDYHAFKMPWPEVYKYSVDLNRRTHRIRDAALLYLIDQYLYHTYQLRFLACFCKQEHEWSHNFDDLEKQDHPVLIQTLGGYDVYHCGEVIHTRNVARAFLVWCYKIASKYMGYVYKAISIQPTLKELLFQNEEVPKPAEVLDTPSQTTTPSSYWL